MGNIVNVFYSLLACRNTVSSSAAAAYVNPLQGEGLDIWVPLALLLQLLSNFLKLEMPSIILSIVLWVTASDCSIFFVVVQLSEP